MTKNTHRADSSAKLVRQAKLRDIVKTESITTQSGLVQRLEQAGLTCTQASVSRDIRELGLVKRDGHYILAEDSSDTKDLSDLKVFASGVSRFLKSIETIGDNLVVIKALPGTAHSVAILLDRVTWPGIAGTVAGDDTVFVAVYSKDSGRSIARNLRDLMKE